MSRWHLERNGFITKNDLPEITRQRGTVQATASMLLKGNGTDGAQNNTFVDSSPNNFAITRNGECYQGSFTPFLPANTEYNPSTHGGSCFFDGTTDYLTGPSNAGFAFGTGDFTLECWVYYISGNLWLFDFRTSISQALPALYGGGNNLNYYVNGSTRITGTFPSIANRWAHIALSRSGTETRIYVDGVQVGPTWTDTTNYIQAAFKFGRNENGAAHIGAVYCSDIRIVKGTAVYTGASFTPPTEPLTAIPNTSLLLRFANAGVYDSCGKVNVLTNDGARISTAHSRFGGSSIYFDGASDALYLDNSPALDFGTGPFTIEFWMKADSTDTYSTIFSKNTSAPSTGGDNVLGISNNTINNLLTFNIGSQAVVQSTSNPNDGNWHHIACVRDGANAYLFFDGVLQGSTSSWSTAATASLNFGRIGRWQGNNLTDNNYRGWLDDIRITKGVALYTSNFTPPAAELSIGPFDAPVTVTNDVYGVRKLEPAAALTPYIPVVSPSGSALPVGLITEGLSIYLDSTIPASYPGSGSVWYDLSGNQRNFTWNTASFTSGTTSYFNTGSGRICTGPASNSVGINNTSGYTIFVITLINTRTQSSAFKFYRNNLSATSGDSRGIFAHITWSDGIIYFDQGGNPNTSAQRTSVSAGTTNTWNVYALRRLTNSSTRSILKNGSTLTTNTASASNIDLDGRAIQVGGTAEDTNWNARLGGFIVYNRGLSDAEVTSVFNTIRGNFGI